MVQYIQKYKKGVATDMRRKGFSYSAIQKSTSVPKSTLSSWLRSIKLTRTQVEALNHRRVATARLNARSRAAHTLEQIERTRASSSRDIRNISRRELWLMGIMLYWHQSLSRKDSKLDQRGVSFTSSNESLIKLFLKWLQDVGNIVDNELRFDIFLKKMLEATAMDRQRLRNQAIAYWANISDRSKEHFNHIYLQKIVIKKRKMREIQASPRYGLLRIRVKSSSMLARQIAGWILGIREYYWKSSKPDTQEIS